MRSVRCGTALAFLETFDKLDGEANVRLRSDDCRHTMAPTSMNYPPNMTNEAFLEHVETLKPVLSAFPVTPKEIFESGEQVTIWATSEAIFRPEVKTKAPSLDWSYHGEYLFVFQFNESGDKITRLLEFIDSKKVSQVQLLIQAARGT